MKSSKSDSFFREVSATIAGVFISSGVFAAAGEVGNADATHMINGGRMGSWGAPRQVGVELTRSFGAR